MKLSQSSVHGILAALYIATHEKEGSVATRVIAEECGLPPIHLTKILQQLARYRLVSGTQGPGGGFTLVKPAGQITLLEMIEAVEGPVEVEPMSREVTKVSKHSREKFKAVCTDIRDYARARLGKTTIKQLMG